jgi:L-2,4-diaminobutyric acid acetyltransferase
MAKQGTLKFKIRNVTVQDIKEVYKLLVANRPYVGLNSRYTYLLLAKDFQATCVVAEYDGQIVAFSSGYIPPARSDTFFSWEVVVDKNFRGHGLQKRMLLYQIQAANAAYFEGTVNPSNKVSENNFREIAKMLNTKCKEEVLFSEDDFENDGHEAEVLFRIGPIVWKEPIIAAEMVCSDQQMVSKRKS